LWQFISALGIPLIGVAASKELANTFKTWANFSNSIKENFNIYTLPNFGWEMDKSIKNFDYSEADYIAEHYLNFEQPKESKKEKTLDGITVCITGKLVQYKNRKLFQDDIEAAGGKVASSVTSKTNFLITNDTTSGSSKNVTAQKLGVEIISEQDFIKRFLT
jgi:DNA ligase (NAD+)